MRKPLRLSILAAALGVSALFVTSLVASADITTTTNPANAPTGTHFAGRTSASCVVNADNSVTCPSYQLAGVGNTNATANLSVTYTATVVCINGGGNPSDSQHQGSFDAATTSGGLSPKNGKLTVPQLKAGPVTEEQFLAQQTCPNPNWTPTVPGGISLSSFTYTLSFVGFDGAFITITGP
jgi:hypothetical protein